MEPYETHLALGTAIAVGLLFGERAAIPGALIVLGGAVGLAVTALG